MLDYLDVCLSLVADRRASHKISLHTTARGTQIERLYGDFFDRPPAPPTSTNRCVWRRCDNRGTKSRAVATSGGRSKLVAVQEIPTARFHPYLRLRVPSAKAIYLVWPMPLRAGSVGNVQRPNISSVASDTDCNGFKRRHTAIRRIVRLCRGCASSSDAMRI